MKTKRRSSDRRPRRDKETTSLEKILHLLLSRKLPEHMEEAARFLS